MVAGGGGGGGSSDYNSLTGEQIANARTIIGVGKGAAGVPEYGWVIALAAAMQWEGRSVTQAAQAVQVSAYPDAYAKWEMLAGDIVYYQAGSTDPIY